MLSIRCACSFCSCSFILARSFFASSNSASCAFICSMRVVCFRTPCRSCSICFASCSCSIFTCFSNSFLSKIICINFDCSIRSLSDSLFSLSSFTSSMLICCWTLFSSSVTERGFHPFGIAPGVRTIIFWVGLSWIFWSCDTLPLKTDSRCVIFWFADTIWDFRPSIVFVSSCFGIMSRWSILCPSLPSRYFWSEW